MTVQKCHIPGQVALITKSCTQRQFLLLNGEDGVLRRAMAYIVAYVAIRTHQVVHGVCFMSNHYHSIQTDRTAQRSKFAQDVHHFATKTVNKFRKRRESIWSNSLGDTYLTDTHTIVEKLLYVWTNPVAAGLVDRVEDWDHFMILPKHWGKPMTLERPDYFTGESGTPEFVHFTPMPPPGFEHMALQDVVALFERKIREREDSILRTRRGPATGMAKVYKTSPYSTPRTIRKTHTLNPKLGGSKTNELAAHLKAFVVAYREALQLFKEGIAAVFPAGTLKMVRQFGCAMVPPGPANALFPRYARYG